MPALSEDPQSVPLDSREDRALRRFPLLRILLARVPIDPERTMEMRRRLPAVDEIPPAALTDEIPVYQGRIIRVSGHRENMAIGRTAKKQEARHGSRVAVENAHGAHA